MPHVYWMGGAPCAGKTSIAYILAQDYGWATYDIDRHVESYLTRADPERHPALTGYRMLGLKAFLSQSVEEQVEQVKRISQEQFEFILDDIGERESPTPLLVEGANMLPEAVVRVADTVQSIIWLVPTESFQLKMYPRRGTWVQDVLRHYFPEDQRLAIFDTWMARDTQMAAWTAQQARNHGIRVISVDGHRTLSENAAQVAAHFGLMKA